MTADELYPIIKNVAQKPRECWSKEEKEALISSLRGVRSFDASQASSPLAAAALQNFFFEYTEWVLSDKNARYALDPYCVIFNFGSTGIPAGWVESLALMPASFGITPLNGSNFAYTVGGDKPSTQMGNARQFCGFMMGRHPGTNAWVFSTPGTLYF